MNQDRPTLVFATNNSHKLEEARRIAGDGFNILSLGDIGFDEDIPEDAPTLEGNALLKARRVYEATGRDCFADDTGLEVDALGGAPGVRSARYAPGEGHDSAANMALLLKNMAGTDNRKARFRTAVALIVGGRESLFEGAVEGVIARSPSGDKGFGYDPVFVPDGYDRSFAELSNDEKNRISHRGVAMRRMTDALKHRKQ